MPLRYAQFHPQASLLWCRIVLALPASLSKQARAGWHSLSEREGLEHVSEVRCPPTVLLAVLVATHGCSSCWLQTLQAMDPPERLHNIRMYV